MDNFKLSRYWFALGAALIAAACHRDIIEDPEPVSRNTASITVNGKPWIGELSNGNKLLGNYYAHDEHGYANAVPGYKDSQTYLSLSFYRVLQTKEGKMPIESLILQLIPYKIGTYPLVGNHIKVYQNDTIPAISYSTMVFDDTRDEYIADLKSNNYVRITNADTLSGLVEGEIVATLYRIRDSKDGIYPDTLRIKNSTFKLYIEK